MSAHTNGAVKIVGLGDKATAADYQVLVMAQLGKSYSAIAAHTGRSKSQIAYRLKMAGISLADYRDDKSPLAQRITKELDRHSKTYFRELEDQIMRMLHGTAAPPP
jgi:hypothetical protein